MDVIGVGIAIVLFASIAYGRALGLPFVGDDYVFLDRTRAAGLLELWSLDDQAFGWYRPWSRELHFWVLQRIAGLDAAAFRAAGLLLWCTAMVLYFVLISRVGSRTASLVATSGVAGLALWGAPLLWISGSQDLWMLCLVLATLILYTAGRDRIAALTFALALLSKETAAVVPALLTASTGLVGGRGWTVAIRRAGPFWAMAMVWVFVHPTLLGRLVSSQPTAETVNRPSEPVIVLRTLLSTVNLDSLPRPHVDPVDLARIAAATLLVIAGLAIALRGAPRSNAATTGRSECIRFGAAWAVIAWIPLVLPSIGWHAYYGGLGVLGAWLALGAWLERYPRAALGLIATVLVLRGMLATTPSMDWGSEWYQIRAGVILEGIRSDLMRQHPTLPGHSRIYFARVPNNIGLIAGDSPALRMWYSDPSVRASFYSDYRPRRADEPEGPDFFFRFDSLRGLIEVRTGAEPDGRMWEDPAWESDHEALAMTVLRAGNPALAASEFEKLAHLPHRADALVLAAVCRRVTGATDRAESLLVRAARRTGSSREEIELRAMALHRGFPGR